MENETNTYQRLRERYETGQVPWDHELPPPEVMAELANWLPGRALDLGCGYGRAAIYLAQRGWQVDAVDFIDIALQEAARRAAQMGVATNIHFYHASVTDLRDLRGPYDFALDVGCMHNFDPAQVRAYHAELCRLLRPNAIYLLFAHLRNPGEQEDESWRWIDEALLLDTFSRGFVLQRVERGITQVGDGPPWRSAWFWFRRLADTAV